MDEKARRLLLQNIPYGLFVVTAQDKGQRNGLTVNWLTQVSFRPPLVAMAIARACQNHPLIAKAGRVAIHFLPKTGEALAQRFVVPTRRTPDKFFGAAVKDDAGPPILEGVVGVLEGKLVQKVETIGDHDIFVFEIVDARLDQDGSVLKLADTRMTYAG
ncbi:MAG: flavin reductase family protein [Deltaproteobacteria bacterium]|nr:flavin reductase family protein [Deltaproteobacteria bacterium]